MAEEAKTEPKEVKKDEKTKPEEAKAKPKEVKVKEKPKEAIQRLTNCMKCNKRLQRKAWYYRDGGYYCSKRCWRLTVAEKKKEKKKA